MELGLTKTESASVYFTGIYKAYLSTQYVFASDINPTISKYLLMPLKISIILYKQINKIRNHLYAIAGVVHAPFMIFFLTISLMRQRFCTRVHSFCPCNSWLASVDDGKLEEGLFVTDGYGKIWTLTNFDLSYILKIHIAQIVCRSHTDCFIKSSHILSLNYNVFFQTITILTQSMLLPGGYKICIFWMLQFGQNSRALCTNMVAMETHGFTLLCPAAGRPGYQASCSARGEVTVLYHTSFRSLVVSMFEWSENVAFVRGTTSSCSTAAFS